MSRISVKLPDISAPVAVELINSDLETVETATTAEGQGAFESVLAPGSYLVRARLPSGELLSGAIALETNDAREISLKPSASPHEWLRWQHHLGNMPSPAPQSGLEASFAPSPGATLWLRLWVRKGGRWVTEAPARLNLLAYDLGMQTGAYTYESDDAWLSMCQLGGTDVPWRLVAVPWSRGPVEILVRPSRARTSRNGGYSIKVATRDGRTESLLHYLASGSLQAAQAISALNAPVTDQYGELSWDPSDEEAEGMLRNKLENPLGAAVAGYYLLRVGAFERMHTWPNNFTNWVRWLPDAAVIHAWQVIRAPGQGPLTLARQRLLEAEGRGVPVYTAGLRLLIDGLELFAKDAIARGERDEVVAAALERLRPYAAAADWSEALTTYGGSRPDEPSSTPPDGVPLEGGVLPLFQPAPAPAGAR